MFPLGELQTTDGRLVEVIDVGLYNSTNAGPDFFNAKIKIDGMHWIGNVELHIKASDWYRHHHDVDAAYDNVVLHVVEIADMDVTTSQGRLLPTLVVPLSPMLKTDYAELINSERYPPCYKAIPQIPRLKIHSWMSALQTERLSQKTEAMVRRVKEMGGSWDDGYFATIARSFGFGINGDAFEAWVRQMPMNAVGHHRDDLFQIEAMFIGQANLLNKVEDRYRKEYTYLQKKFGMEPMNPLQWRYLRTRPQNFPHNRIMQLARMYHERRTGISELLECTDTKQIAKLYGIKGSTLELLIINAAVPTIFAYGRHHAKEYLCERAFDLLEQLKPENNNIVRMWQECGLEALNAGDSQALIQLKKEYCDKKECLRCRFGYEFLTGEYRNRFLSEKSVGQ